MTPTARRGLVFRTTEKVLTVFRLLPTPPLAAIATSLLLPVTAAAQDDVESRLQKLERENAELRQQMDSVSGELERFEFRDVMPPVGASRFGMGPAASKVYEKDQGFSIGGYGEGTFRSTSGDQNDEADFLRGVLYTGYKFDDQWVFNSETEFEHASTSKGGSASVEFAYLEHLCREEFNVRAGLLLAPMGFLNEMHEPTTFYGASRPETERRILPSTWRENGVGVHGEIGDFSYKAYVMNGFDGGGFSAKGLRGGRQKGSEAKAEDLAFVARLDWSPTPGVVAGVSAYHGDSGQGDAALGDVGTSVFDAHFEGRWRGLRVRGLYAFARLEDTRSLFVASGPDMTVVGKEMHGPYLEAGWDVMEFCDDAGGQQLIPFVRYEGLDTHHVVASGLMRDRLQDETILSFGLNWMPIDQIVFKASFQDFDRGDDRFELGMGYVF